MLGMNKSFDRILIQITTLWLWLLMLPGPIFFFKASARLQFYLLYWMGQIIWYGAPAWFSRKWRPQRLEQWSWCWNFYLQQSCYKHKHPPPPPVPPVASNPPAYVLQPHGPRPQLRHHKLNKSSWQGRTRSQPPLHQIAGKFPLSCSRVGGWWTLADTECDVTCILLSWWLVYFISILWNSCILVPHCI